MSGAPLLAQAVSMASTASSGRCVVVGYDAGPSSERALSWALRRAGRTGRVVVVTRRAHPARPAEAPAAGAGPAHPPRRAGAVAELPFLERRDVYGRVDVDWEVRDEDPASALIEVAADRHADEIVVGSRRRSRLRSLTGSVCGELLRRSETPVVVVP